jgi:hypothetical protein
MGVGMKATIHAQNGTYTVVSGINADTTSNERELIALEDGLNIIPW